MPPSKKRTAKKAPKRPDKPTSPPADDAVAVSLNPDDYTLGELEDAEDALIDATGRAVSLLATLEAAAKGDTAALSMKVIRALVWLVKRRTDPDVTFDDLRDLRIADLEAAVSQPDPSSPAAAEPGTSSGRRSASSTKGGRSTTSGG